MFRPVVAIIRSDHPQKRPQRDEGSDMQLNQAHTKILQATSHGLDLHVSCFDNIGLYFMYYYVVHPHTQYRGAMPQQGF